MSELPHQDWTTIVLRKPSQQKSPAPQHSEYSARARRLESDLNAKPTEEAPPRITFPVLSAEMRKEMVQARVNKKLSQEDLAKAVNTQKKVIQDLEGGKTISDCDKPVLQRINKVLMIRLKF